MGTWILHLFRFYVAMLFCLCLSPSWLWAENTTAWRAYGFTREDLRKAPASLKDHKTLAKIASLIASYPEISHVTFKKGDWVLVFKSSRELYWAQGRLLPEELRRNYKKYRPYISYRYPKKLEDPKNLTPERIRRIKMNNTKAKRAAMPAYEGSFFELIYRNYTRESLEANLVRITFLDRKISVHRKIAQPLQRVNQKIMTASKKNSSVGRFLREVRSVQSYAWRKIRGSTSMSFHSLAVAVDILPKNRQKIIYWAWEAQRNPNWPAAPLSQRWIPPKEVIDIFEENGFIWGGRWTLYDNMHFEYRPELLMLQRLDP